MTVHNQDHNILKEIMDKLAAAILAVAILELADIKVAIMPKASKSRNRDSGNDLYKFSASTRLESSCKLTSATRKQTSTELSLTLPRTCLKSTVSNLSKQASKLPFQL